MVNQMERREWVKELRGAIYRGDGARTVGLLQDDPEHPPVWQLIGDGLATALAQRSEGAGQLAADCVAALRLRDWVGDVELADQLEGLAGTGPSPLLQPLAVDLEQLSEILEGDPLSAGGALDLHTGEVWPRPAMEYVQADGSGIEAPDFEDGDRFRWVDGDSRAGYRDMVVFIDTVADEDLAERLRVAIRGRGAFRRFAATLRAAREDEVSRWLAFTDERKRGRARAWLVDVGCRVTSR
jgi:Uncharacterised protein family (UPF0158)